MNARLRWRSKGTLAMAAVLLLFVLLSVARSHAKSLWFDELGTLNVASQPTLSKMFRVEPADGNPPLQYLLVRPCLHLFGVSALRLPAMAGLALAMVCAYLFVGRRFGATAGLLTPTLLLISRIGDYGVEARPYALLMGLTMLALVLWQQAAEKTERREGMLAGLAAAVFALIITQPMGILWAGVPLLAGEGHRSWRLRRVDRPMLLALLVGFSGFAITAFFGHATQQQLSADAGHNHSAIALPTVGKFLQAIQVEGMLPVLGLFALLGGLALWQRRRLAQPSEHAEQAKLEGAPLHEWVAIGAFALTIFAVFLFTEVVTHYFWARYIAPGVLGWFVLAGMVCGAVGGKKTAASALALGVCLIGAERRAMVSTTAAPSGSPDSVMPSLLTRGDPTEAIVIGKPFFFPQIWWYSSPAVRARLHYLADAPIASTTSDFVPELTLLAMHRAGSALFPPDDLRGFLAEHKRFLFWRRYVVQGDWQEDYLRSHGYVFTPVASSASGDETLYQVEAPVAGR